MCCSRTAADVCTPPVVSGRDLMGLIVISDPLNERERMCGPKQVVYIIQIGS